MFFGLIKKKRRIFVQGMSDTDYKIRVDDGGKMDAANETDQVIPKPSKGHAIIQGSVAKGSVDEYHVVGRPEVLEGDVSVETEEVLSTSYTNLIGAVVLILVVGLGTSFYTS